jgi:NAD(P)H-hydrate epimerase
MEFLNGRKVVDETVLKFAAIPRKRFGSKRDNGSVVIIGGSSAYHGAPVLASLAVSQSLAALRIGIGYAVLYVPESILNVARKLSPNVIIRQFGIDNIGEGSLRDVYESIEKADVVIIGTGIGRKKSSLNSSARIIDYSITHDKKVVVDADAIYSVKFLKKTGSKMLVTPQKYEFEELSGRIPEDEHNMKGRIAGAENAARRLGCCLLLKGHNTIVTDGEETRIICPHRSTLATMGTGDVLSGMIGGYAASGADIFNSGIAAAYLHAKIGDKLYAEKGNHILASDVVDSIPEIIKKYDKEID